MFSTLRNRFGIPGAISVIALVFAMFGGAYAASNSSGGGKATASAAKGKPGPRGKTGKTGPAGPQGPAGPVGPAGPQGAKGDPGVLGSNGAPGASVSGAPIAPGSNECASKAGGVKYTLGATSTPVCNGKDGETGFTEVLPSGKTETGAWSAYFENYSEEEGAEEAGIGSTVALPFAIPLAASLDGAHVFAHAANYDGEDEVGTEHENCPGSAENPQAAPGFLCVYTGFAFGTTEIESIFNPVTGQFGGPGAATAGAGLHMTTTFTPGIASGTWAVTAE